MFVVSPCKWPSYFLPQGIRGYVHAPASIQLHMHEYLSQNVPIFFLGTDENAYTTLNMININSQMNQYWK